MSRVALFLVLLCPLGACARYRHAPVSLCESVARLPDLPTEPLAFEDAVRRLVEHHPELLALRSAASAVNLSPGPAPLLFRTEVREGRVAETTIGTDVLSLLGIGPRQAERALARAMLSEAIRRHHERARGLVAELAAAYAEEAALRALAPIGAQLDVEAYRRSGIASAATLAAADAARTQAEAENAITHVRLVEARRRIAQLLAASPGSAVDPVPPPPAWPPVPEEADDMALFLARGDLLRERAAYDVADHQLRLAVKRQWPNLGVFLGANVDAGNPMQMVAISLPLSAPAEARAMAWSREQARFAFEAAVLRATHDARSARHELERAEAALDATAARWSATRELVDAAQARIGTDPETFDLAVRAALDQIQAGAAHREAITAVARARAQAAHAAGWPTAAEIGVR